MRQPPRGAVRPASAEPAQLAQPRLAAARRADAVPRIGPRSHQSFAGRDGICSVAEEPPGCGSHRPTRCFQSSRDALPTHSSNPASACRDRSYWCPPAPIRSRPRDILLQSPRCGTSSQRATATNPPPRYAHPHFARYHPGQCFDRVRGDPPRCVCTPSFEPAENVFGRSASRTSAKAANCNRRS